MQTSLWSHLLSSLCPASSRSSVSRTWFLNCALSLLNNWSPTRIHWQRSRNQKRFTNPESWCCTYIVVHEDMYLVKMRSSSKLLMRWDVDILYLPPIWSRSLCDQVNSIVVVADILPQQLMQHDNIGYLEFSFLTKLLHCQTAILGFCRFFEFYWLPHKLSSQAIAPIFPEV